MELAVDQPFDLAATLACGQGHRWLGPESDGWYESVLGSDTVRIRQKVIHSPLEFEGTGNEAAMAGRLLRQFRLDDDIEAIYGELKRDPEMAKLVERYPGMRVMRVDPWECLAFFICSANTGIPRIHECMEKISTAFGTPVSLTRRTRHTFPKPHDICNEGSAFEKLQGLRLGLDKESKIHQAAVAVYSGNLNLDVLAAEPSSEKVIGALGTLYGVGDKVANCVALFSLEKLDAFPIDVHIDRNLQEWFGKEPGFPTLNNRRSTTVRKWAQGRFGSCAGYAESFLFFDALTRTTHTPGGSRGTRC